MDIDRKGDFLTNIKEFTTDGVEQEEKCFKFLASQLFTVIHVAERHFSEILERQDHELS